MRKEVRDANTPNEFCIIKLDVGEIASNSWIKRTTYGVSTDGSTIKMTSIERQYQDTDGYTYIVRRSAKARKRHPFKPTK